MKNVGFSGGSSIFELGPSGDVELFFECINFCVVKQRPDHDWSFLTDRLYRRYLTLAQLDYSATTMGRVREQFAALSSTSLDLKKLTTASVATRLDLSRATLLEVFDKYFQGFDYCVKSAKIGYESFKSYKGYEFEPVKIVISDLPQFFEDKSRPLEAYDALKSSDQPFWLR